MSEASENLLESMAEPPQPLGSKVDKGKPPTDPAEPSGPPVTPGIDLAPPEEEHSCFTRCCIWINTVFTRCCIWMGNCLHNIRDSPSNSPSNSPSSSPRAGN